MPYTADSPITVVDYEPEWPRRFKRYATALLGACGDQQVAVEHVGSTAVPGLAAKPIIDIVAFAASADACLALVPAIETLGWLYKPDAGVPGRLYFRLKSPDGVHLAHLHLYPADNADGQRLCHFRDYLISNPGALAQYALLKRTNASEYPDRIDEYVGAKSAFIRQIYREMDGLGPEPIVVVDYDPAWPARFEAEARRIRGACGDSVLAVEHIGSTSVPGLAAEPVIDVLAVVASYEAGRSLIEPIEMLGYYYYGTYGTPRRHYFRLEDAQQTTVAHVHLLEAASAEAQQHLSFRDYLRRHPGAAAENAALKRGLAVQHRANRAAYTDGKAWFIQGVLEAARREAAPPR